MLRKKFERNRKSLKRTNIFKCPSLPARNKVIFKFAVGAQDGVQDGEGREDGAGAGDDALPHDPRAQEGLERYLYNVLGMLDGLEKNKKKKIMGYCRINNHSSGITDKKQ